jgi:hypothetical protein
MRAIDQDLEQVMGVMEQDLEQAMGNMARTIVDSRIRQQSLGRVVRHREETRLPSGGYEVRMTVLKSRAVPPENPEPTKNQPLPPTLYERLDKDLLE